MFQKKKEKKILHGQFDPLRGARGAKPAVLSQQKRGVEL